MAGNDALAFLDTLHPIFRAREQQWERDERRTLGLPDVAQELREFQWEVKDGEAHRRRQESCTYINFPEELATVIVGHVFSNAPAPDAGLDFGQLGKVRRVSDISGTPSEAELLYYNTDGIGNDGSQWDNFWEAAMQRACCTGHRWILADASRVPPMNRQDEMAGLRPFLVEYSPLDVPNWHFVNGTLAFAIVRLYERDPALDDSGLLSGNDTKKSYLLLVREGFQGFGTQFAEGGWWRYNTDKTPIDGLYHKTWDKSNGEIPMGILYAKRGTRLRGYAPHMSTSMTTEVGNIAVAYMNLSSARDFDVWDAAKSIMYLMGASPSAYKQVKQQMESGSRLVAVPTKTDGSTPTIVDSATGAVPHMIMDGVLTSKLAEADRMTMNFASGTPQASGVSKNAGFQDMKAPKLRLVVSEIEACQNTMLRFLELLWGKANPQAYCIWDRKFDLLAFTADVVSLFDMMKVATAQSATLVSEVITKMLREKGIVIDEGKLDEIRKEITESLKTSAMAGLLPPGLAQANNAVLDAQGNPVLDANGQPVMKPAPAPGNGKPPAGGGGGSKVISIARHPVTKALQATITRTTGGG